MLFQIIFKKWRVVSKRDWRAGWSEAWRKIVNRVGDCARECDSRSDRSEYKFGFRIFSGLSNKKYVYELCVVVFVLKIMWCVASVFMHKFTSTN